MTAPSVGGFPPSRALTGQQDNVDGGGRAGYLGVVLWRIALTVLYAGACVVEAASWNDAVDLPSWFGIGLAIGGVGVGFAVGRPWVVLAAVGGLFGRTIGWESGDHDGASALWFPYVLVTLLWFGAWLGCGFLLSWVPRLLESWRQDPFEADVPSAKSSPPR
jgi:hypothetical protein